MLLKKREKVIHKIVCRKVKMGGLEIYWFSHNNSSILFMFVTNKEWHMCITCLTKVRRDATFFIQVFLSRLLHGREGPFVFLWESSLTGPLPHFSPKVDDPPISILFWILDPPPFLFLKGNCIEQDLLLFEVRDFLTLIFFISWRKCMYSVHL